MDKVKNQHYIPRSYLQNFAHQKPKAKGDFVFTRINGGQIKEPNIENICSQRYFYDIPEFGEAKKQFTEKFYSEYIDAWFPEVTEFILDDSQEKLPDEMRGKIIGCCIGIIFRTPKFLRADHEILDMYDQINGQKLDEEAKRKITAIYKHYEYSMKLMKQRAFDGIAINKAPEGSKFITCDNPVLIYNSKAENFDYFDPDNIIHFPISPTHSITITPSTEQELSGGFYRSLFNKASVLVQNNCIKKASELFLIGSKSGMEEFESDMETYDKPTPQGLRMYTETQDMHKKESLLLAAMKTHGAESEYVKSIAKYFWAENEHVRNDPSFRAFMRQLNLNIEEN